MASWGFGIFENDAAQDFLVSLPSRSLYSGAKIAKVFDKFFDDLQRSKNGVIESAIDPENMVALQRYWEQGELVGTDMQSLFERDLNGKVVTKKNCLESYLYESYEELVAAAAVLASGLISSGNFDTTDTERYEIPVSLGNYEDAPSKKSIAIPRNQLNAALKLVRRAIEACEFSANDMTYIKAFDEPQQYDIWRREVQIVLNALREIQGLA